MTNSEDFDAVAVGAAAAWQILILLFLLLSSLF